MGGNDCLWWGLGSQAEEAETWDRAETRVAGRCGSGSVLWRVGGGCVEPVAQPAGCGVQIPSLLSADTLRGETIVVELSRLQI